MTLGVIIPTCNRPEELRRCLASIHDQLPATAPVVIHVSDDGWSDTIKENILKEFPNVQWHEGPQSGPAVNRNHGAVRAEAQWLVFTDDDCIPAAGWLDAYIAAIQKNPDILVFEGRTTADRAKKYWQEESPINELGGNLWSCNFAIRRDIFLKVGGFNETFPFACAEDMELNYRLRRLGYKVSFIPEALIIHPWRRHTCKSYLRQCARYRKSEITLVEVHGEFARTYSLWNLLKDPVRYYVKQFPADIANYGVSGLLWQPFFLWTNLMRIGAHAAHRIRRGNVSTPLPA